MISMVERKDIISAYEQTGSMRAVSTELGLSRKTVKKYVKEYLAAKNAGDEALVLTSRVNRPTSRRAGRNGH